MASMDLGTHGSRRETNRELALVPFIDFLLCLVAFLLVTAVWARSARLPADATSRGDAPCGACTPPARTLHVTVEDERFVLSWRDGSALLSKSDVRRDTVRTASGDARFPELARALENEWRANGVHRASSDPRRDSAVVHAPNSLAYAELVGVMDSIRAVRRAQSDARASAPEPAFAVSLAVD